MNLKLEEDDELLNEINVFLNEVKSIEEINEMLKEKTGIFNFFNSHDELSKFKKFLNSNQNSREKKRDMGDFQTPRTLTDKICQYLFNIGFNPSSLIEPTCGNGNFIISALNYLPSLKYIYCIELQERHEWLFKLNLLKRSLRENINVEIEFWRDDIFTHHFSNQFTRFLEDSSNEVLILGNPPWITNTELSTLNSKNIPFKSNIKGHDGIEAITGKGNFDIAEYIITQMIKQFTQNKGKIAMLCKTSVIKNLIKDMDRLNLNLSNIKSLQINTKKEFNINADASLFLADIGRGRQRFCTISSFYNPNHSLSTFGWINNKFVSDRKTYEKIKYLEGISPFTWRQGVKHDAIKIMVLRINNDKLLMNGLGETVDVEEDYLFPFLKSSDLKDKIINHHDKKIIITQTSLNDNTNKLADKSPRLWSYLLAHSTYLDNRKSIIYKNRARFSIFGIGDYAFKPYKIAISGFYKNPIFSFISPINNKPVMLDDTCYYLSFDNPEEAIFTWTLLNMPEVKEFLTSIVFLDSKRPYTKEKLMRIDLSKLIENRSLNTITNYFEENLKEMGFDFPPESDFKNYLKKINLKKHF